MLARGEARRRELAVRAALGAVALPDGAAAGDRGAAAVDSRHGGAGWPWRTGRCDVVVAAGPDALPRLADVGLSLPVLRFAAALAMVTTLLFGAGAGAAAVAGRRGGRAEGRRRAAVRRAARAHVRRALVVGQVAIAVVLAGRRRAAAQEFCAPARRAARVRRRRRADREDRGAGDTLSRAGRGLRLLHRGWSSVRRRLPGVERAGGELGAAACRCRPATGASTSKGVRGSVDAGPAPPTGMSSLRDTSRPCAFR